MAMIATTMMCLFKVLHVFVAMVAMVARVARVASVETRDFFHCDSHWRGFWGIFRGPLTSLLGKRYCDGCDMFFYMKQEKKQKFLHIFYGARLKGREKHGISPFT